MSPQFFKLFHSSVENLSLEQFNLFVLTDSSHQRAGGNLRYFERLLTKQLNEMNQVYEPPSEEPIQLGTYRRPKDHLPEREAYEALCRGEGLKMVRYLMKNSDMLRTRKDVVAERSVKVADGLIFCCKWGFVFYSKTVYFDTWLFVCISSSKKLKGGKSLLNTKQCHVQQLFLDLIHTNQH